MQENVKTKQKLAMEIRELIAEKFSRAKALTTSPQACFFGEPYYLTPYEVAYLICIIEEREAIYFNPGDFESSEFYTLAGLSSCVNQKVVAMQKCTEGIKTDERRVNHDIA